MAAPIPRLRLDVPEDHVQATEQLNRLLRHIEDWMRGQEQAAAGTPAGAPPHAAGGSFGVSGGTARMTGPKRPPPHHIGPQPAFQEPHPTPPAPTIDAIRDDGMTYARPLATDLNNGHVVMTGSTGQYNIKGVGDAQTLNLDSEIADGTTYARPLATALTSGSVDLAKGGVIGKTLVNIGDDSGSGRMAQRTYALPNSGGTPTWFKLGTWVMGAVGTSLSLKVHSGQGYNSGANQQTIADILVRSGNGSGSTNISGLTYIQHGGGNLILGVAAVATSGVALGLSWDIYVDLNTYSAGHFDVHLNVPNGDTWSYSGSAATPPAANGTTSIWGTGGQGFDTGAVAVTSAIDFSRGYTNKHLGNIPDDSGSSRYAVAAVDANKKALIDATQGGHVSIFGKAQPWASSFARNGAVLAGGGLVYITRDGISWFQAAFPLSSSPPLVWTGRQYIAAHAGASNSAATSPDALNWTTRTIGGSATFYGLAWSPALGLAVAVGSSGAIYSSPDGVTWTSRTSGTANALNAIAWSAGLALLVAVGAAGTILTSPDGVTWTSRTSGTANALNAIAWSADLALFVAVGASGTILTSPDGVTWTSRTSGTANALNAITWSGSLAVAVGNSATILTSPDGVTWTSRTGGSGQLTVVGWTGYVFVTAGTTIDAVYYSYDGTTWTQGAAVHIGLAPGFALGLIGMEPAVESFLHNTISGDQSISANTPTAVFSVGVMIPPGGPSRIRVDYGVCLTAGATSRPVDGWVSDGTNVFAGSQMQPVAASAVDGLNGGGYSPVTYAPGTSVTLKLYVECAQAFTVKAAAVNGGWNTWLDIACLPAN